MPKRQCCPECFDDRALREQYFHFWAQNMAPAAFVARPTLRFSNRKH
jgi:hypothetical protein